jgi:hypothetical protein
VFSVRNLCGGVCWGPSEGVFQWESLKMSVCVFLWGISACVFLKIPQCGLYGCRIISVGTCEGVCGGLSGPLWGSLSLVLCVGPCGGAAQSGSLYRSFCASLWKSVWVSLYWSLWSCLVDIWEELGGLKVERST